MQFRRQRLQRPVPHQQRHAAVAADLDAGNQTGERDANQGEVGQREDFSQVRQPGGGETGFDGDFLNVAQDGQAAPIPNEFLASPPESLGLVPD